MMLREVKLTSYSVRDGYFFSQQDAEIVGPIFAKMAHERRLTAPDVVAEACGMKSPLRPYFEWDNTVAAHKYRLDQAGKLIAAIVIQPRSETAEPKELRAFVPIPKRAPGTNEPLPAEHGSRGVQTEWVTRREAEQTEWMREHLRKKALRMLLSWRAEYEAWAKLDETFLPALEGIEETARRFKVEGKPAEEEALAVASGKSR